MEDKIRIISQNIGDDRIKLNVDLKEYTQSRISVSAAAFYLATNLRELTKVIDLCNELDIKYLVIGSGSKVQIQGTYFEGIVIKNRADSVKIFGIKGKVSIGGLGIEEAMIEAESGATIKNLVGYSVKQGLTGLENLVDEVGTVGGSLLANSYLREKTHQIKVHSEGDASQTLVFQDNQMKTALDLSRDDIILSVIFKLKSKKYQLNHAKPE